MSKVTTKTEVRLSYTNLLTPRAQSDEKPDELTYSTAVLIPKEDKETITALKAAIKEALAEGVTKKWGGKTPKNLKNPMRDGDAEREDDEVYKGHFFINAKGPRGGREKPILLDSKGNETDSIEVIYSGVYARVSLQFYPFDVNGNRGVACGVSSLMSMEHGDPLGNTVTAASARDEFGISTPAGDAAMAFAGATSETAADADDDDPWGSD
jgi:Protein of unknown function (DUF2815).